MYKLYVADNRDKKSICETCSFKIDAEKYLKKGSEVAVEGKLTNRSYEDKNGETHFVSEIVVNEIMMLDKKGAN